MDIIDTEIEEFESKVIESWLEDLPAEVRLKGLAPEERLEGLAPEELARLAELIREQEKK